MIKSQMKESHSMRSMWAALRFLHRWKKWTSRCVQWLRSNINYKKNYSVPFEYQFCLNFHRECINRVREAAKIRTPKSRRVDKKIKDSIADNPCLEHSNANVIVNINSSSLTLISVDTGEIIAKHEMPKISFASSGDTVSFNLNIIQE